MGSLIPKTASRRKVIREVIRATQDSRYAEDRSNLVAVLRGDMLADGPDVRRRILEVCEGWRASTTILPELGRSVDGGLRTVLDNMTKDGLLEVDKFRVSRGRWRFVRYEARPAFHVWRRSPAGAALLRRMQRRDAIASANRGRR